MWETITTSNIGLDFGFFNNRLSGAVDYFIKNTEDMILQVPIPGQVGLEEAPYQNAGEMRNNGIELSLNYKNMEHDF
jgi:outer membrane receptor protein involved in Fe transport